jgi:hypothetical protein
MDARIALASVFGVAALASAACAEPMTASEIQAALVGQELCTARSGGLISELIFCFTYNRDGTFKLKKADTGEITNWNFDKDQICLFKVSNPKEKSCAAYERVSDKRFKVNGKDTVCLGPCED